jgi:hypothetical protein
MTACHSDRFMHQTVAKQRNNVKNRSLHAPLKTVMVVTLSDEKRKVWKNEETKINVQDK